MAHEIRVPDIGDYRNVEVIDVLVRQGDTIAKETPLITLESDKAAMDIPATMAGTIRELKIKSGDKVNAGDLILTLDVTTGSATGSVTQQPASAPEKEPRRCPGAPREAPPATAPAAAAPPPPPPPPPPAPPHPPPLFCIVYNANNDWNDKYKTEIKQTIQTNT